MALREEYDAAIVVSSDTDLMPAIETVYTGRLGHIELATWAGAAACACPAPSCRGATSSAKLSTGPCRTSPTTRRSAAASESARATETPGALDRGSARPSAAGPEGRLAERWTQRLLTRALRGRPLLDRGRVAVLTKGGPALTADPPLTCSFLCRADRI